MLPVDPGRFVHKGKVHNSFPNVNCENGWQWAQKDWSVCVSTTSPVTDPDGWVYCDAYPTEPDGPVITNPSGTCRFRRWQRSKSKAARTSIFGFNRQQQETKTELKRNTSDASGSHSKGDEETEESGSHALYVLLPSAQAVLRSDLTFFSARSCVCVCVCRHHSSSSQ